MEMRVSKGTLLDRVVELECRVVELGRVVGVLVEEVSVLRGDMERRRKLREELLGRGKRVKRGGSA